MICVNTARHLKYIWPFFSIMHKRLMFLCFSICSEDLFALHQRHFFRWLKFIPKWRFNSFPIMLIINHAFFIQIPVLMLFCSSKYEYITVSLFGRRNFVVPVHFFKYELLRQYFLLCAKMIALFREGMLPLTRLLFEGQPYPENSYKFS